MPKSHLSKKWPSKIDLLLPSTSHLLAFAFDMTANIYKIINETDVKIHTFFIQLPTSQKSLDKEDSRESNKKQKQIKYLFICMDPSRTMAEP